MNPRSDRPGGARPLRPLPPARRSGRSGRSGRCTPTPIASALVDPVLTTWLEFEPGYAVRIRFTLSDIPVLTSWPPHRPWAIRAAGAALIALGCGHLGGHLEIGLRAESSRGPALAISECLAVGRAVESAIRGGCGTARVTVANRTTPTSTPIPDIRPSIREA